MGCTTPIVDLTIQRNSSCACGGGCPRCQAMTIDIKPKLNIEAPGDKYEQEADRVADQMMRMPDSVVQRKFIRTFSDTPSYEEEKNIVQAKPIGDQITFLVQRQQIEEEAEGKELNKIKVATGQTADVCTPKVTANINSFKGGGRPLSESERAFFEPKFGYDFSSVKIHTGTRAKETAHEVNARAFTIGQDVVFGEDQYAPQTIVGKALLAHELTHVVQQSIDGTAGKSRLGIMQRQRHPAAHGGPSAVPSALSLQIFRWLEAPLKLAVQDPAKLDQWGTTAVAGLVLIYNKLRNENLWQYVSKITKAELEVNVNFLPIGGQASLPARLAQHKYVDCLASIGLDWGLRREGACGPHLHFKHFKPSDEEVNVHIDKIDPCCGRVPIFGPPIAGLRHWWVDKKKWAERHPKQFIELLGKQNVPLSEGILNYLKRRSHL